MIQMLLTLACTGPTDPVDTDEDSAVADSDSSVDDSGDAVIPDCSGGTGEPGFGFFEADGESYWLYVPEGAECMPLLLFGHGGNNNGSVIDGRWGDMMRTGLTEEADRRGYAVMVPFLEDVEGNQQHGWDLKLVDEMQAMIEGAAAGYDIDRSKVIFAGTSAGGHMACYWGLYEPEGVTSVAVLSAGLGGYFDYPDDEPDPKLPFIVFHDPKDEVVPYSYSENLVAELEAHGHEYTWYGDIDLGEVGHGWSPQATGELLDTWLGIE
ncbi:MAG: hypothetical protein GY913_09515 [Proteobacteria bacterium]|nr:hypothetical protein [Pseudomonadota bacterium]MCP4917149.1 hypothetical protein [Pseudomonadota bacterium]